MFPAFVSNGAYLPLIYLIISGNFMGNLFGCRVQQMFRENMALKHVLGLFTTYFLIILSTPPPEYTALQTLLFTAAIYGWFFLTTKMHVSFWIPMIVAALGAYFIWVYLKQRDAEKGVKDAKDAEKGANKDTTAYKTVQSVLIVFAATLTVLGVVAYYGEKRIEYGNKFDPAIFWLGRTECAASTPAIAVSDSFLAVLGIKG